MAEQHGSDSRGFSSHCLSSNPCWDDKALAGLTRLNPEKVRDCVGTRDMVAALRDYYVSVRPVSAEIGDRFQPNSERTQFCVATHKIESERRFADRFIVRMAALPVFSRI